MNIGSLNLQPSKTQCDSFHSVLQTTQLLNYLVKKLDETPTLEALITYF